jgi:hypothetical protein
MFTNLDITDMETCYKLFRRELIQAIELREDRFGFEPEITAKVAQTRCRVYECAISYTPRTAEDGKKINGQTAFTRSIAFCIMRPGRASAHATLDIFLHRPDLRCR